MTIRKLFPLLLVAVVAVVAMPERASAQGCWICYKCVWGGGEVGKSCLLPIPQPLIGYRNCHQDAPCDCYMKAEDFGFCHLPLAAAEQAEYETELAETLAAISANRTIPADGRFFYTKRGSEFVVRRKCDVAEVGRVAISEVEPVPVLGAG